MIKKRVICFLWLLVIAVAAMIFYFSTEAGEISLQTSGGVVTFLLRLFVPDFDGMTYREKKVIFDQLQYLVRKAAHFTEFAMLGASLRLLFHALGLRWPILCAWAAGTLYACSDEWHQMIIGTRTASWWDVALDSVGVFIAVLLTTLWLYRRKRKETRADHDAAGMKNIGRNRQCE